MADLEKLAALIESNRADGVDFGQTENAPLFQWVEKAEQRLGKVLPPTYKWFLANYGGGEIHGDEVFSIYGMEFETVFGGDVVFQYLAHQRSRTLEPDEVPLTQTDQGEIYYLKTSSPDANGEYPVFIKRGEHKELYASDFASFLEKRIKELEKR
jgi:hypothetical protein